MTWRHVPWRYLLMLMICSILNIVAVNWFGEVEFWMSLGKVLLLASVFFFTFVTMVGGNPRHDAYGFRYWNNPVRETNGGLFDNQWDIG
jgi:amino acid permease